MIILEGLLVPCALAVLCLVLLVCFDFLALDTKQEKEPPGPRSLPILGNLLQLDLSRPYEGLCKLSKKHGSVFTVHFGPKKVVVLAGYKTVKEALVNYAEEFGNRDILPIFHDFNKGHGNHMENGTGYRAVFWAPLTLKFYYHSNTSTYKNPKKVKYSLVLLKKCSSFNSGNKHNCRPVKVSEMQRSVVSPGCDGILFSNGETWRHMRRFALSTLRDFGMGKKVIEQKIREETQYLIEVFQRFNGAEFDTSQPVNYAVSNIISAIVYGNRFDYADPEFQVHVNRANETVAITGYASIQVYNIFPWLRPFLWSWKRLMKNMYDDLDVIRQLARRRQETLSPQDCHSFIDSFLIRSSSAETMGQKDSLFHEDNLVNCVSNLFAAGTDTTGTTLRWGLLLMAKYPQIQDRVQREIDSVIGVRQPMAKDRKSLPYTDAVIHETQRLANIVPMSIPHSTSCDVHFQGYFIKKDTPVIPLLTSVLRDEAEWETPYSFNPDHFLDGQGKFVQRDAFLPFSAGRRACLGESLARMELFLFFTTLLQRFHFTPPPGVSEDELDLTPAVGFTLTPSPHKLSAVPRSCGD